MVLFLWCCLLARPIEARVQDSPLSPIEAAQLGTFKVLKGGRASQHRYPTLSEWPRVRAWLVERSLKCNSSLDVNLTAYTPGETLGLLRNPIVRAWHARMVNFEIPAKFKRVIFVPCAKTKPWSLEACGRSQLYRAYHRVVEIAGDDVYFVTLSEPLGVVPQELWADFPQYDNPGLFRDEALRSGAMTSDWLASPFAKKLILPFDNEAHARAIMHLSEIIARFIQINRTPGREFFSFLDTVGSPGTHSEMLGHAISHLGDLAIHRFLKRPAPRATPCDYILKNLSLTKSGHDQGDASK